MTSALFDNAGMRALDAAGLDLPGMAPGELMERAGQALLTVVRRAWPRARRIGILCGPGNNGGDGYVLARLAAETGLEVWVHGGASRARPESDGRRAYARWRDGGGEVRALEDFDPAAADLWVDCLFGIGLERPLTDAYGALIEQLNASDVPVLAADVPSGVDIDTGRVLGQAVRADRTLTMIADKLGLHTGAAVDCAGEVEVASLDLPGAVAGGIAPVARRLGPADWRGHLPARRPGVHKGDCGHVLVVGGAPGYSGAARLAATAALRAGAGRVTLATHPEHAAWANQERPELMVQGIRDAGELQTLLRRVDVVAVGPGLGQDAWGRGLWLAVADAELPRVVDADALNLLAEAPRRGEDWILTPHPGEAARLQGTDVASIEADRPGQVHALVGRLGGVVLLKGAGTLVADAGAGLLTCVTGGHPGMATAGSGDVLTGIIAALRGQGADARTAAEVGAAWHCAAACVARDRLGGARGMLAGDLADALPAAGGAK
ncbi:bifunctional ADP-dependent NAD(P)H-hydrate dehydratase/NAD(P)H-hydrate epimerase [Thioalkalivibrio sp. AKL19]|uniref:bifunctional ADP-dependent NAD(P)H-hydrate dehydratase/NAD(P)H-hydrate epimerase n=1 Tax=Thioalkalivibrio sp. AKL19 TaxID=1266914 RepID=UPI0004624F83|nr:bifunctional ADP-dependent NAD(P)H-hydrate dehydratase/NAD(P)H-hydrate epimerase [Thioalkalivibrio sp. AKL19]